MKTRAITGFFFVLVMLASVIFSQYAFAIFFTILSLLSLYEFYQLVEADDTKPQKITGILIGASIFIPLILHFLNDVPLRFVSVSIPFIVITCIGELYRATSRPFSNLAFTFFGILYVVIPFAIFCSTAFFEGTFNYHIPLGILLLLWASDTGAYLFGVKFGKTKLFERHSPKKSWEGFLGGMFTSLVVSFILGTQYLELDPIHWAVMSFLIVVGGTYGDLCESMLKRSMNKKDSGTLLPGHGGLLDRFDGLLFAAPLVFVYLYLISS
ncbi:phosphatidate cytidylyltransferase [Pedobacter sp. SYSU D00535]|uniref:phosphatidate cytidylyltransferase n=1 Tax=Pedobacter sp. SYSU D00535 TaxID=2810308 RepID=UPI001A962525|nr:phosphatidate cytidylyltransferase [Pedobacter sp. SYSU D00535]